MELRLYTFVNFYLSSIQQGIQSLHVLGDMMVKYTNAKGEYPQAYETMLDWAQFYKTSIVLNGGIHSQIEEDYKLLVPVCDKLNLPIAKFHEDQQSLGSIMTSFGMVLPQSLYDAQFNKDMGVYEYRPEDVLEWKSYVPGSIEFVLLEIVKSKPLAR